MTASSKELLNQLKISSPWSYCTYNRCNSILPHKCMPEDGNAF